MKRFIFTAVLCLIAGMPRPSAAVELAVATGDLKGTDYQFGLDLQRLMRTYGIALAVYDTAGSVENIYAVFKRPGVHLGFVQSDVLAFVSKVPGNSTLRTMTRRLKIVFPLYDKEVHLVAGKNIDRFEDLQGKKVAVGPEESGTYFTAKLLLESTGVHPKELLTLDMVEALEKVKRGEADAMFYVGGAPVRLFVENAAPGDRLRLIPIVNRKILAYYPKAVIPKGTYVWQPKDVPTVAVTTALITFNYRRARCAAIGRFARIVRDNMAWLMENGHPKWKQVDLERTVPGWETYDCVRQALARDAPPVKKADAPKRVNPVLQAIKTLL